MSASTKPALTSSLPGRHPSDMATVVAALCGTVTIADASRERRVAIADLNSGPGEEDLAPR